MVSVPFLPVRLPSATKPAFLTTGPGPQTWLTDHSCYEASLRRPRCSRVHPNHHLCFRPPSLSLGFLFLSFPFLIALFYSAVTIRKSIPVNPRQPRQRQRQRRGWDWDREWEWGGSPHSFPPRPHSPPEIQFQFPPLGKHRFCIIGRPRLLRRKTSSA